MASHSQIVAYAAHNGTSKNESQLNKNVNALRAMGIAELVLGSVSVILGITAMAITSNELNKRPNSTTSVISPLTYPVIGMSSQGLWCGVVVIITGVLAIALKHQTTRCLHISNMLLSIICAFTAFVALIISIIMALLSMLISKSLVRVHGAICVLDFVILILMIVHSCFCCRGACYSSTSGSIVSTPYIPAQNTGFSQSSNNLFENQPPTALPCAQFVPLGSSVHNHRRDAESLSTAYELPDGNRNVTATPAISSYAGYEAPNLALSSTTNTTPLTVNDLRNPPGPEQSANTSNAEYERTSFALPRTNNSTPTTRDIDYVEPNRIEYGQVPNVLPIHQPQPSPRDPHRETDAVVSRKEDVYLTLS